MSETNINSAAILLNSTFQRFTGRVNSILMVPVVRSPETRSEATAIISSGMNKDTELSRNSRVKVTPLGSLGFTS
ncbi:hypothetical protein D3C75_1018860 [compost metagenome]